MKRYYLAVDVGASSGRHILGWVEDGKIVLDEIFRLMSCFAVFITVWQRVTRRPSKN